MKRHDLWWLKPTGTEKKFAEQQMNAPLFSTPSIWTFLIPLIPTLLQLICNTMLMQQAFHMLHMLVFRRDMTYRLFFS